MKIYLAGPMRGYPDHNYSAFTAATCALRALGHVVFSPHEFDETVGFTPMKDESTKAYMRYDLPKLLAQDAVVVLPGWEKSVGASLEVHVAQTCEMPVYELAEVISDVPLEGLVL